MRHLLGTSFSTSRPSHPSNELHCTQHHLLGKPPPQFFSAYVGASANSYRFLPHSSQPLASPSAKRTCPWGERRGQQQRGAGSWGDEGEGKRAECGRVEERVELFRASIDLETDARESAIQ